MINYKLTNIIEDKLFSKNKYGFSNKYAFTYKFYTPIDENDDTIYVIIYRKLTGTRLLTTKLRNGWEYKNVFVPKIINELCLDISYRRVIEKYKKLENRIDDTLEESFIYIGETLSERIKYREYDSLMKVEESDVLEGELTIPDYDFYAYKGFKLGLYYDYAVEEFLFTYINIETNEMVVQEESENMLGYNIEGEEDFSPITPDEDNFYPHKFYIKCNIDTFKELQNLADTFKYTLRNYITGKDIIYNDEIRYIISNADLNDLRTRKKQYENLERYLYLNYVDNYDFENHCLVLQCNDRYNNVMRKVERKNDDMPWSWNIDHHTTMYFLQAPVFNIYKTKGEKDLFYTEVVIDNSEGFNYIKLLDVDRPVDYLITSDDRLFVKYHSIGLNKVWDNIGNKDIDDTMTEFIIEAYNKILDDNEGDVIEIDNYAKGVRTIYVDYKNAKLELDDKMRKMLELTNKKDFKCIIECYNKYIEEVDNYIKDYINRNKGNFEKVIERLTEDTYLKFEDCVLNDIYRDYGMEMYYIGE